MQRELPVRIRIGDDEGSIADRDVGDVALINVDARTQRGRIARALVRVCALFR